MAADFVGERGGGLLVLGGRSFAQRGLSGTPLEEVLPVELNDRRGGVVARRPRRRIPSARTTSCSADRRGERHPIMRIGASADDTRNAWAALPALAAERAARRSAPGRDGAGGDDGAGRRACYPVVAVQRYGRGRSMVFAGEASWRWRMMSPSTDRGYEFFWRQAARWLSAAAPDPVAITVPDALEPGDTIDVDVDARDASFAPGPGRDRRRPTLTAPGGEPQPLTAATCRQTAAGSRRRCAPDRAGPLPGPRGGATRVRRRSAPPIAGSTSAAPTANSPIRG